MKSSPPKRDRAALKKWSKAALIEVVLELQETLSEQKKEHRKQVQELTQEVAKYKQVLDDQILKKINEEANKPSSKKPEWDKEGYPKSKSKQHSDSTTKKKRKKRPGCGNKPKSDLTADEIHLIPLENCPDCGTDLSVQIGRAKKSRRVEDIAPPPTKTTVSDEIEEAKWCPKCKKMVSSKTEQALPGADIGLDATIEIAYRWVMSALSFPKIQAFMMAFKAFKISTAGLSKIMIRLSDLLQPVYDEILNDVKQGTRIHADETGWRVKGTLWWLWIFANARSAYYWPDEKRGGDVVEKILGTLFYGILIVDGWRAYNRILCDKQSCMAHVFRKIRKFIEAYPQYRSIMTFYLRLRKIIRDGVSLQTARCECDELTFQRRLKRLHHRLDDLLAWKNPNESLKEVIKKVTLQRPYILTFVEYDGAPSHNNYGEYIIKKGVVKRKMSGGSMSVAGVRAYACIQSIAMTCQLRKLSFHDFLKMSLIHYIRTGKPMLLAEYESFSANLEKMVA